ncbi:MAG: hypothetical protein MUO43_07335 [Desulfobacterales bacterium]|nr:hypothetical protein [Desulfobacterales bacterium]
MQIQYEYHNIIKLLDITYIAAIRNRDREEPHDSPPPTPPGIRITYHGGSVD